MKRNTKNNLDAILDEVTAQIRDEKIEPTVVAGAASRVWARLANERAATTTAAAPSLAEVSPVEHIRGCAGFQSLIPAYLRGDLSNARSLLLEDHTQECIPCRKALKAARAGNAAVASRDERRKNVSAQALPVWKWAIAATLVIGFGLTAITLYKRLPFFGDPSHATVEIASGAVYRVSDTESRAIKVGEEIARGERIRTAKESAAVVRLADGSLIEMKERSEFSVSDNSQGTTIHLDRGNVIVEAAKQRQRQLYVATDDALVSVTGTIFSVNSGTKGSRVSVVEGEVHVTHAGNEEVLRPGDQTTTHTSLEKVPVQQEVAWSRNAERYGNLLTQLTALGKELNQKVPRPGVRYSTRFLDLMPEGTVLYAALPNLAASLAESHKIMQERIGQNAALSQWWQKEAHGPSKNAAELDAIMARVREFGEHLGSEIVVSAKMDEKGEPDGPLVMAELRDPANFRPFLEKQIASLTGEAKGGPKVHFIDDPLTATALTSPDTKKPAEDLFIWIHNDIMAASPKLQQLQQLAAASKTSTANRFVGTSFHSRIADIYREGAGLIVAADLEKIITRLTENGAKRIGGEKQMEAFRQLGLLDLKHFIVEQKEGEKKTHSRAVLTFSENRHGLASWLAAPGPMGSLEFISPDANVVAAFVVKEPVALVDDLLNFVGTAAPELRKHLEEFQQKQGFDIRQDFAAPLGGEFAFAIDGPILPTPSWKMVFEVYDQARLQATFERMVDEVNKLAAKEGKRGLQWERSEIGGRTFYTLRSVDFGVEMHYAYINGYLVAAPSRALVNRAVRFRDSGSLLRSSRFMAGLPADGNANFSALIYHDLAPLIEPIARRVGDSKMLPEEQREALKSFGADTLPTLAYAYAQGDRITFAANTEGGPFGLSINNLLGMPTSFGIQHILHEGLSEKNSRQ